MGLTPAGIKCPDCKGRGRVAKCEHKKFNPHTYKMDGKLLVCSGGERCKRCRRTPGRLPRPS
jgi:hypothetical protein